MSHLFRIFSVLLLSVWAMSVCHATTATQVVAASDQTCAITPTSTLKCWGIYNGAVQVAPVDVLGIGGVGLLNGVTAVTAGNGFTCALLTTGSVACWGSNGSGQLGDGTTIAHTVPALVKGVGGVGQLMNIAAIAVGRFAVCALTRDGGVVCWGDNSAKQLGDNTGTNHALPAPVLGVGGSGWLSGISSITMGMAHVCAMTVTGGAVCWGSNQYGQVGDNTTTERGMPVVVQGVGGVGSLSGIAAISAGWLHTCALTTAGNVLCWGDESSGDLGDGTRIQRDTPVNVLNPAGTGMLSGIAAITAGNSYSCAITYEGQVYCWGSNIHGQLGINQASGYRVLPTPVFGLNGTGVLSGIQAITAGGGQQTCALTNSGDVLCWGDNFSGELGINSATPTQVNTPVYVYGFNNPPLGLDGSYKGSSIRESLSQQ